MSEFNPLNEARHNASEERARFYDGWVGNPEEHQDKESFRRANEDFARYLEPRPYQDDRNNIRHPENGQFINYDTYHDMAREKHYEETLKEDDYSNDTLKQLAERVAAARAQGDRTKAEDAESAFFEKFAAYAEKYGWDEKGATREDAADNHLDFYTKIMYGEAGNDSEDNSARNIKGAKGVDSNLGQAEEAEQTIRDDQTKAEVNKPSLSDSESGDGAKITETELVSPDNAESDKRTPELSEGDIIEYQGKKYRFVKIAKYANRVNGKTEYVDKIHAFTSDEKGNIQHHSLDLSILDSASIVNAGKPNESEESNSSSEINPWSGTEALRNEDIWRGAEPLQDVDIWRGAEPLIDEDLWRGAKPLLDESDDEKSKEDVWKGAKPLDDESEPEQDSRQERASKFAAMMQRERAKKKAERKANQPERRAKRWRRLIGAGAVAATLMAAAFGGPNNGDKDDAPRNETTVSAEASSETNTRELPMPTGEKAEVADVAQPEQEIDDFSSYVYPWNWAAEQFGESQAMDKIRELADKAAADGHVVEWNNVNDVNDRNDWLKIDGSNNTKHVLSILNQYNR